LAEEEEKEEKKEGTIDREGNKRKKRGVTNTNCERCNVDYTTA